MSKLTILVGVYKSAKYIVAKLRNLQRQTVFDKLDIVLLNCQNLQSERTLYKPFLSNNIREIVFDDYCTLYHSWNVGIQSSNAEYFMNSNADDMLKEDACEIFISHLQSFDVVASYYAISSVPNMWDWDGRAQPNKVQRVAWDNLFLGPSPAVRRSVLVKSGLYDPELFAIGDADIWGRWRKVGATASIIGNPLVLYYHSADSLERRRSSKGMPLTYVDSITRKRKNAADWDMVTNTPVYPSISS